VYFLTPDVAIMHSVGGTILAGQSDIESERNSVHTIVAKKDAVSSQWRIVAFQNGITEDKMFVINNNTNFSCNLCNSKLAEIFQENGDWQEYTYPDV
jgi:hypothetical protein